LYAVKEEAVRATEILASDVGAEETTFDGDPSPAAVTAFINI
jgi:hypothetical protein